MKVTMSLNQILNLRFEYGEIKIPITVKEYMLELLKISLTNVTVIKSYNISNTELIKLFIQKRLISGQIGEDGTIEMYDSFEYQGFIDSLVRSMFE